MAEIANILIYTDASANLEKIALINSSLLTSVMREELGSRLMDARVVRPSILILSS